MRGKEFTVMQMKWRILIVLLGTLGVVPLYFGWMASVGHGFGLYTFAGLLLFTLLIPLLVMRGLPPRSLRLKVAIVILGYLFGAVVGWLVADVVDHMVYVPNPELDQFRMRLDLLLGALMGAVPLSSIGTLVASRSSFSNCHDR
jgi:hypothetical protein